MFLTNICNADYTFIALSFMATTFKCECIIERIVIVGTYYIVQNRAKDVFLNLEVVILNKLLIYVLNFM